MDVAPMISIGIREIENGGKMEHDVTIVVNYRDHGSNDMVGVEALSDMRKLYGQDARILYTVYEDEGIHSTIIDLARDLAADGSNVTHISEPRD